MKYLFLFSAIFCEVIATISLKFSYGFTKLIPSIVVVIGCSSAFYLLSLSLKYLSLGSAYAIWSGLGTALTAVIGILFLHESFHFTKALGILLIIIGVVVLHLTEASVKEMLMQSEYTWN